MRGAPRNRSPGRPTGLALAPGGVPRRVTSLRTSPRACFRWPSARGPFVSGGKAELVHGDVSDPWKDDPQGDPDSYPDRERTPTKRLTKPEHQQQVSTDATDHGQGNFHGRWETAQLRPVPGLVLPTCLVELPLIPFAPAPQCPHDSSVCRRQRCGTSSHGAERLAALPTSAYCPARRPSRAPPQRRPARAPEGLREVGPVVARSPGRLQRVRP